MLDQVNLFVSARVGGRAAAFPVTAVGVETRRLEGVGTQSHLIAAAAPGFALGRGQQPGAQARPAMIITHPEEFYVAASAPGPPEQPPTQLTAVPTGGDTQQPTVGVTRRRNIEGVDLCLQALPQAIIDIACQQRDLTHHRLLPLPGQPLRSSP